MLVPIDIDVSTIQYYHSIPLLFLPKPFLNKQGIQFHTSKTVFRKNSFFLIYGTDNIVSLPNKCLRYNKRFIDQSFDLSEYFEPFLEDIRSIKNNPSFQLYYEHPVHLYTDGGFRVHQKSKGAYAYVAKHKDKYSLDYGLKEETTVNEMETLAILKGLKSIRSVDYPVHVHTDSQHAMEYLNVHMYRAAANNWERTGQNKRGIPIQDKQLWSEIYQEVQRFPYVKAIHVKGHNGIKPNEYVDKICSILLDEPDLISALSKTNS